MLSRVARNIYWMARYLERAENTARIVGVHSNLLMDLPRERSAGWEPLLAITGSGELFRPHFSAATEGDVVAFLIGDPRNPGCILSSLQSARENLRTTRDIIPRESFEAINDLYLWTRDQVTAGVPKYERHDFLRRIIRVSQQINGFLQGSMSRGIGYDFLELGRYLERADMTTRVLDVRAAHLLYRPADGGAEPEHHELNPYENIQWMSVLRSLTAYQMYRQHVRLRVQGADVLAFLLQDPAFPRAYRFCLDEIQRCLERLPRHQNPLRRVVRLQRQIQTTAVRELAFDEGLHEFIDGLQIGLAELHDLIDATYLNSARQEPLGLAKAGGDDANPATQGQASRAPSA